MSRRTAQAVFEDLGENGRLRMFEQINEAREMAEIDTETFGAIRKVIFGGERDLNPALPELGACEAGVLLETAERSAVPGLCPQGQAAAGDDGAAVFRRGNARQDHPDRARRTRIE
jgi:hypothetical protein